MPKESRSPKKTTPPAPARPVYLAREWVSVDVETGEPVDEDCDEDDELDEDQDQDAGRAVTVSRWRLAAACVDWKAHGHQQQYSYSSFGATPKKADQMSQDERAEAKKARALVIRCNRDWATAEVVRREWVSKFLTRKTPPKDAGIVLANVLVDHRWVIDGHKASSAATDLLATPNATLAGAIGQASTQRAYVIALGVVLAACEAAADRGDWRGPKASTAFYLNTLAAWGYELAEVEQRAAGTYTETGQPD